MIESLLNIVRSEYFQIVLKILYYASFVFIPLILIAKAWKTWILRVQAEFFSKQKYILLEIKVPKEVTKSPEAMEFLINNLHQNSGEGNWHEKYWKGSVRPWFSLEITSIGGAIHFFIWTRAGFKNLIESNLYSQFPGIEIFETNDYTLPISYNPEKYTMWASEFDLTKPDVFPIKTYLDYKLDENPEEEYKIDPLTPLIEFLGSVPKDSQVWVQILVRSHKEEDKDPTTGKPTDLRWAKAAQKEIDSIIEKTKPKEPGSSPRQLTDIEKETINSLGRSVSKKGFDVGIRALYIAPKDSFSPSNIGGIIGSITHFNSNLNGFKPARGVADKYSFPLLVWKERKASKVHEEKSELLDKYKKRAYFHLPLKSPHFVLNSEELATLFHFPGGVSTTPTYNRIESKKAEAPTNLPI